jgi:hypothetical protein
MWLAPVLFCVRKLRTIAFLIGHASHDRPDDDGLDLFQRADVDVLRVVCDTGTVALGRNPRLYDLASLRVGKDSSSRRMTFQNGTTGPDEWRSFTIPI